MRAIFHILMICLMFVMPLHGAVASGLLPCAPSNAGAAAIAPTDHAHHHANMAEHADHTQGSHHGTHQCGACSACCVGVMMTPPALPALPELHFPSARIATLQVFPPSVVTGHPERPPKTSFA